jgi:hypothetical protein
MRSTNEIQAWWKSRGCEGNNMHFKRIEVFEKELNKFLKKYRKWFVVDAYLKRFQSLETEKIKNSSDSDSKVLDSSSEAAASNFSQDKNVFSKSKDSS